MKNYKLIENKKVAIKIKIKAIFIIVFLAGINVAVLASPKLATKIQIGMFLNSTTCVVLDNSSISYQVYIKNAVKSNWKLTVYEFIDQQEFEKRRYDSKYSFLMLMKGTFEKDPEGVSYNYLSLVLGDTAKIMTNMPELCSIPLSYSSDNNVDYGYALPSIVNFMQKHVKTLQKRHFFISISGLKYYNNKLQLRNKELLLNKDVLADDANTPEKIKKKYPYSIKLLTTAEIEKELELNPVNTLFNLHVGPSTDDGAGKCFEMIFDTDGNLYYYKYRKITNEEKDGFNMANFADLR